MKFYWLLLAYLAVVCELSNAATDGAGRTDEEIEEEFRNKQCDPGTVPSQILSQCVVPDPSCYRILVECVPSIKPTDVVQIDDGSQQGQKKTYEELERERAHMHCPFGQRPALVQGKCPAGANNPVDCPYVGVKCVPMSFGNDQPASRPSGSGPRGSPKTEEELNQEFLHKVCIFGERPAYVKIRCPPGASDTRECAHVEVRCVPSSFGNTPQESPPEMKSGFLIAPPKTQEQLDQEMAHKECPFGQRPAQVKERCPYAIRDPIDCPNTVVRCIPSSFGNDPNSSTRTTRPSGPAKSIQELDSELSDTKCPTFGHKPAYVKEYCPPGALNTLDCPPSEIRCVQSSFGNDQHGRDSDDTGYFFLVQQIREDAVLTTFERNRYNRLMMEKECPPTERAAIVKEKCPYGAFDVIHCPEAEIKCIPLSFGNDPN